MERVFKMIRNPCFDIKFIEQFTMEDPTTRAKEAGQLVLVVYVTVVVVAIGVSLSPLLLLLLLLLF